MRIISQDGSVDFPYEVCYVWILGSQILATLTSTDLSEQVLATYSTQEKAKKAMQMLHSYYKNYMTEKIYKQGIRNMWPLFQFPQENEI